VFYRGKRHVGVNRSIGHVTQADNLYPWRTLRQNVSFRRTSVIEAGPFVIDATLAADF
jgi:ABC-type nitrate/sulfonate/bicarbonate transport system ATPase subunit